MTSTRCANIDVAVAVVAVGAVVGDGVVDDAVDVVDLSVKFQFAVL